MLIGSCFTPATYPTADAVEALASAVEAEWGAVDVLVNNAGINTNPRAVGDVAPEDWDQTIAINLTGVYNMMRVVLPGMRQQNDGLIITDFVHRRPAGQQAGRCRVFGLQARGGSADELD